MSLELLGRVHKELSLTGNAVYEAILAISERVNRKVQIIRLHWQASLVLERMDRLSGDLGRQLVDHVSRRFLLAPQPESTLSTLDNLLVKSVARIQELKQSLAQLDQQIRDLKVEAIHHDLLRLQQDLALRSARLERITIARNVWAAGQPLSACPLGRSVHIATILRGPFLLPPSPDLILQPDDIVVLIGLQSDLDLLTDWLSRPRSAKAASPVPV